MARQLSPARPHIDWELEKSSGGTDERTADKQAAAYPNSEKPLIRPDTPNQGQVLISLGRTPSWNGISKTRATCRFGGLSRGGKV